MAVAGPVRLSIDTKLFDDPKSKIPHPVEPYLVNFPLEICLFHTS
jgi:hypothetical protein